MEINITFGKRIKELRIEKGIKTDNVAKQLGITPRALRYYEAGEREPSLHTIYSLCKLFDVTADYLLGLTDI